MFAESGETVGKLIADHLWLVVVTSSRLTAVTDALGVFVNNIDAINSARISIGIATGYIIRPTATLLATIPITGSPAYNFQKVGIKFKNLNLTPVLLPAIAQVESIERATKTPKRHKTFTAEVYKEKNEKF